MKRKNLLIGFFAIGKSHMQKESNNRVQEMDVTTSNTLFTPPDIIKSIYRGACSVNEIGAMTNLCIIGPDIFYNCVKDIPKFVVYPSFDQKEEYLERMNGRDVINGEVFNLFYHFMKEGNNFDKILSAYEKIEEDENTIKVVLKPGQYLSDVIDFDVERGFYLK